MFHLDSSLINIIVADKAFPVAIFQNSKPYNKSSNEREDFLPPTFIIYNKKKTFLLKMEIPYDVVHWWMEW